jgi:hypothetical protein
MTRTSALLAAALVLTACRAERSPQHVEDEAGMLRPIVTITPVNRGTYGMIAQVRWMHSPDRTGILVVVNAVGIEAEAVPNGFFFGLEQPTFATQVDSVWDVVPSPDWRTVAFSRAHTVGYGEDPEIPDEQWESVSRATGIDIATLRASAFPTTAMAYAQGIAQPAIIQVPPDPRAQNVAVDVRPRTFPIARGWQLRWSADGNILALGSNPRTVQDDSPSESWSALDPRTGSYTVALPAGTQLVQPQWVEGPNVGVSEPFNVTSAPPIQVRARAVNYILESERGVITIRDPAFETHLPVTVGPGVALAASASGRFVVALRPRQEARPHEPPVEVVVYTLTL